MIISDQTPANQTPQGKLQQMIQDRQNMQMGQKLGQGASYLKNKAAMATMPNHPMMGTGTRPMGQVPQLSGAGGASMGTNNACPTCGGPMNMQSSPDSSQSNMPSMSTQADENQY